MAFITAIEMDKSQNSRQEKRREPKLKKGIIKCLHIKY